MGLNLFFRGCFLFIGLIIVIIFVFAWLRSFDRVLIVSLDRLFAQTVVGFEPFLMFLIYHMRYTLHPSVSYGNLK